MARKGTGRKRERGDHSLEPNKREHSDNTDDRYMEPTLRLEDMEEVEELTDPVTGGLAFPAGVIKMLDIMHTVQLDSSAPTHATEMALAKRALLAKIVASTSRADCVALFFREGGLDALQAWLHEAVQAAPDFPSCRAHIDALLVALLIAVERTREPPSRLHDATLAIVHRLSAAECQFSDQVRLRAVRLGRSWGAGDARHASGGRVWDCGDSSTSGAEVALGTKDDPSPSTTSTERDDTTDTNHKLSATSARPGARTGMGVGVGVDGSAGGGGGGVGTRERDGAGSGVGDALAGVEEAAGIMRLVTMNSPVAAAAAASAASAPAFGPMAEERGGRQEDQRTQQQQQAERGGLLGGAVGWEGPHAQEGQEVGALASSHAHWAARVRMARWGGNGVHLRDPLRPEGEGNRWGRGGWEQDRQTDANNNVDDDGAAAGDIGTGVGVRRDGEQGARMVRPGGQDALQAECCLQQGWTQESGGCRRLVTRGGGSESRRERQSEAGKVIS